MLKLKRNPKLLDRIRNWSKNPDIQVIGFKLTDTGDLQQRIAAVKKQFDHSKVDAVVHNDLSEINASAHPFSWHMPAQEPVHCADSEALATRINQMMETGS